MVATVVNHIFKGSCFATKYYCIPNTLAEVLLTDLHAFPFIDISFISTMTNEEFAADGLKTSWRFALPIRSSFFVNVCYCNRIYNIHF